MQHDTLTPRIVSINTIFSYIFEIFLDRGTSAQPPSTPQHHKLQRDLGLPAEAFEVENCCMHCCSDKNRPQTVPAYHPRRPQSRPPLDDDLTTELEATIIEPLQQTTAVSTIVHRGRRMSALEVVEEERTPGTTPSPNYLPDIHHNQRIN